MVSIFESTQKDARLRRVGLLLGNRGLLSLFEHREDSDECQA